MEAKKSFHANLETKRTTFIGIGLIISISICLYGFETNSGVSQAGIFTPLSMDEVEEILTPLVQVEEKKPELPPLPKIADLILISENTFEPTEDVDFYNSEVTPGLAINKVLKETQPEKLQVETIFINPEEMPEFPGGNSALLHFLSQNIKYPEIAAQNGIFGKVTISFVVNKDGTITDAKVLRSVDPALDQEALRVVYSMPKWKPGKQAEKPVRVSFVVPINFKLQ